MTTWNEPDRSIITLCNKKDTCEQIVEIKLIIQMNTLKVSPNILITKLITNLSKV